jgi:hypothetical protein
MAALPTDELLREYVLAKRSTHGPSAGNGDRTGEPPMPAERRGMAGGKRSRPVATAAGEPSPVGEDDR